MVVDPVGHGFTPPCEADDPAVGDSACSSPSREHEGLRRRDHARSRSPSKLVRRRRTRGSDRGRFRHRARQRNSAYREQADRPDHRAPHPPPPRCTANCAPPPRTRPRGSVRCPRRGGCTRPRAARAARRGRRSRSPSGSRRCRRARARRRGPSGRAGCRATRRAGRARRRRGGRAARPRGRGTGGRRWRPVELGVKRRRRPKSRRVVGLLSEKALLPGRILQHAVHEQEEIEVVWLHERGWVALYTEQLARSFVPKG